MGITARLKVSYNTLLQVYEGSKDDQPKFPQLMDSLLRLDVELARARQEITEAIKAQEVDRATAKMLQQAAASGL